MTVAVGCAENALLHSTQGCHGTSNMYVRSSIPLSTVVSFLCSTRLNRTGKGKSVTKVRSSAFLSTPKKVPIKVLTVASMASLREPPSAHETTNLRPRPSSPTDREIKGVQTAAQELEDGKEIMAIWYLFSWKE